MNTKLWLFCLSIVCSETAYSDTTFTYRANESKYDTRYEYDRRLLELALQKTEVKYGPFKLVPSKPGLNEKRVFLEVKKGTYQNFFLKQSVTPEHLETLLHIPFPLDRGVVGYRVAFVSESTRQKLTQVKTLEGLKQFTVLQGLGWVDADILRQQGFEVILSSYYDPMFKMVARDRAHLFLRGINEVLDEWQAHKHIKHLVLDDNVVIQYPLPRFFFTTKSNTDALNRVQEGILIAYHDGSLIDLWKEKYQASIDFSKLKNRRFFALENPIIKGLDDAYKQYNFDPLNE
ncbi:MAG: hypothetical protein JKY76_05495 [Proteobacteria bacterium]|nr:hypothetical protein [Pseudomonadota bacterium]